MTLEAIAHSAPLANNRAGTVRRGRSFCCFKRILGFGNTLETRFGLTKIGMSYQDPQALKRSVTEAMTKSLLLVAAGVLVSGGAAGALSLNHPVSAASGITASAAKIAAKTPSGARRGWRHSSFMGLAMTDVANTLHISTTTLAADLKSGDSIATIAKQNQINLTTVESTLVSDAKTAIQTAVTAGHLTSAQASKIEANLSSRIDAMVTQSPGHMMWHGAMAPRMGLEGGLLKAVANTLKISTATVRSDLNAGDSLATIAINNNSSASALITALVNNATTQLQSAVSSGKLTQAQATKIEGGLTTQMTTLVNQAPLRMPPDHHFGAFAMGGGLIKDAATALNLPVSTLRSDLQSGKTLASIAGPSQVSSLESTLVQDATANIQSAVKAGKMSATMATKLESHLTQLIDGFVTGTGHPGGPGGWGPPPTSGSAT